MPVFLNIRVLYPDSTLRLVNLGFTGLCVALSSPLPSLLGRSLFFVFFPERDATALIYIHHHRYVTLGPGSLPYFLLT